MEPSGRRLRNNSRTESHLLRIINFDGGLPVWREVSEQARLTFVDFVLWDRCA